VNLAEDSDLALRFKSFEYDNALKLSFTICEHVPFELQIAGCHRSLVGGCLLLLPVSDDFSSGGVVGDYMLIVFFSLVGLVGPFLDK